VTSTTHRADSTDILLRSNDYVLIRHGVDDVCDGQLCKVLAPDESAAPYQYQRGEWVAVHCWTGYIAWTSQDNLIPLAVSAPEVESLFEMGRSRTGAGLLQF
jgi:hypothetical protein